MTKRASGEKLPTVNIGDGLVLKDSKIEVSIGKGLELDSGKVNVELVHQPFVGGAASVSVNGSDRSAYSNFDAIRPGSSWKFYAAKPLQMVVLNFGGVYKISLRGELQVRWPISANNYNSLLWYDILSYFGDATPSSLINTVGTGGSTHRPYGPGSPIWLRVTRRVDSSGTYESILGETHGLEPGTAYDKTYFMRFNTALAVDDRVVFDSVFYWAVSDADRFH